MKEVDTSKIILITSIIAAFAALLSAGLTGLVQVWLVKRQAAAEREADLAKRRADGVLRDGDRKRELYVRWLKWQISLDAVMGDAMVTGSSEINGPGTFGSDVAHQLADFRAELLLYASSEVRTKANGVLDAWAQMHARRAELSVEEDRKPREQRDYRHVMTLAINETVLPYIEDVAQAMRAELDGLAT